MSRVIAIIVVAWFAAGLLIQWAEAHEFYSYNCCAGHDCRPLPDASVRETPEGYVVTIPGRGHDVTLKYGDPRLHEIPPASDDGVTYHVCTTAGSPDGMVLCVYHPGRGA